MNFVAEHQIRNSTLFYSIKLTHFYHKKSQIRNLYNTAMINIGTGIYNHNVKYEYR